MSNCNSDERPVKRRRTQQPASARAKPTLKKAVHRRLQFLLTPTAPLIVSSYAKVAYHCIGISITLYIMYLVLQSLSSEVEARYYLKMQDLANQARICHDNYVKHNCGPNLVGPLWQKYCEEWDRCSNFRPQVFGKSRVIAQVFGELMNAFVEPLTYKTMLIIFMLLFGFFIIQLGMTQME